LFFWRCTDKVTKNPLLYQNTKHYMLATLHGPEPSAPFHKIYVPIGASRSKTRVGTWNFINTTHIWYNRWYSGKYIAIVGSLLAIIFLQQLTL
jgi:hypothetical protein